MGKACSWPSARPPASRAEASLTEGVPVYWRTVSDGLGTGTPASWLKPSLRAAGLDPDDLPPTPPRNYDSNRSFTQRKWVDTWTAGQGLGAIKRISPVAAVVDELEREYWEAARLWRRFGQRAQETA